LGISPLYGYYQHQTCEYDIWQYIIRLKIIIIDYINRNEPKKLLDRARATLLLKQYANKTEQAYLNWIKQYILFHDKKHPQDMGASEVDAFLTGMLQHLPKIRL